MTSEEITRRIRALNGSLREMRKACAHNPGYHQRDEIMKMMAPIAKIIADLGRQFDAMGVEAR